MSSEIKPAKIGYLTRLILGVSRRRDSTDRLKNESSGMGSSMGENGHLTGKYGEFTFEVLPSKVVSSFWTPNLNKLFDDFTVEVVAIRTAPAKTTFTGFSRPSEHLSYLIEALTDEGQIVGHFEVK